MFDDIIFDFVFILLFHDQSKIKLNSSFERKINKSDTKSSFNTHFYFDCTSQTMLFTHANDSLYLLELLRTQQKAK